jgi:hypothetical protein
MPSDHRPWLFDPIPRIDLRYPRRVEAAYDYLNASARSEAACVRLAYRTWLGRYPADQRGELVRRFRDSDDRAHAAAAFELALHEMLVLLGGQVSVPRDQHGRTRYDFDVVMEGETTAVEASLVTDDDDGERQQRRRADALLDALDERRHLRLAVHVWECRVDATRQPSYGKLRTDMLAVLDSAHPDDIAQWAGLVAARDFRRLPRWVYERSGSKVVFSPVPIPPGVVFRGHVVRLDPVVAMEKVTIGDAMLGKIRSKAAKRYDLDGRPLVLALAVTHWAAADDFEVFRALLGTERWPIVEHEGKPGLGPSFRDSDGAWGPHSRHGLSSVSAVLIFRRFQVWAPWSTTWRVYLNPWARTPPPKWLARLPRWDRADMSGLAFRDGLPLSDLLPAPFAERPEST